MPLLIEVPSNYGVTALIALGAIPLLAQVQGAVSTTLRKKAGVPYPNCYATHEQAKNSPAAYKFNCAQRAHANLLENMTQVIASLLFSGLYYPTAAPVLGGIWVVFRAIYAYGYITSTKPEGKGRLYGSGGMFLGQTGLLVLCIMAGYKML